MIPHLAVPFHVTWDGSAAVNEQDSYADVAQCVAALCGTPAGSRPELPGYGIPELGFTRAGGAERVLAAVAVYEPRAAIIPDERFADDDPLVRTIRLAIEGIIP